MIVRNETFAQQPGELGRFILQHEKEIIALGLRLFGAQGFWAVAIAQVLAILIDECVDPWKRNREFRSALATQNQNVLQDLAPVASRSQPPGLVATEKTLTVKGAGDGVPGWAALVIPWDQTVTVTYHVHGHGALCHQELALVQIVGNDNGTVRAFWSAEAEGVSALNPYPGDEQGTIRVELPAGDYMVQAVWFAAGAQAGYSSAEVSVAYETAPIPWWAFVYQPWFKWAVAAASVGAAGTGVYWLAKR